MLPTLERTTVDFQESPNLSAEAMARRLDLLEERRSEFRRQGAKARLHLVQVLNEMGSLHTERPELDQRQLAISYFVEAVDLFKQTGEKLEEANTLGQLGDV